MKKKFKVAELPHAFFNSLALDGCSAGVGAVVVGETLFHETRAPAAAFLRDAVASDGKRVAIIAPVYPDSAARWSPDVLARAVPPSIATLRVEAWPHGGNPWRAFSEYAESAARLVAGYTASVNAACHAAIHSADDTEGEKPVDLAHYVRTINALLTLDWCDKVTRANLERLWYETRDRWQLSDTGDYSLTIVRAIAQRDRIMELAREALPRVRDYFSRRGKVATLRDRLALTGPVLKSDLESAIARVLRAGVPDTESLPVNMLQSVARDFAATERAERMRRYPAAMGAMWRRALDGNFPGCSTDGVPARFLAQIAEARELSARIDARRRHKQCLANLSNALEKAESNYSAFLALSDDSKASDAITICQELRRHTGYTGTGVSHYAEKVESFAPRYPLLASPRVAFWRNDEAMRALTDAAGKRADAYQERAKRERLVDAVNAWLEKFNAARASIATTPRAALVALRDLEYHASTWNARQNYGDAVAEFRELCAAAIADAMGMRDAVSAIAEWKNGGAAPELGDWLRINGNRARTTRGVEVPTRAIVAALRWLDSQPEGAAHPPQPMDIGGYDFAGRDAAGFVRVGCHTFSPDAVADIRAQLQERAA